MPIKDDPETSRGIRAYTVHQDARKEPNDALESKDRRYNKEDDRTTAARPNAEYAINVFIFCEFCEDVLELPEGPNVRKIASRHYNGVAKGLLVRTSKQ